MPARFTETTGQGNKTRLQDRLTTCTFSGSFTEPGCIERQISRRGWTKDMVFETIRNYDRSIETRDRRYLPGSRRLDEPATAYINKDGSYVVVNDRTGDIVQISDRSRPDWKAPWE